MVIVDRANERLVVLGAVTGSSNQAWSNSGLLLEVGGGIWFRAHRGPGPYLLSLGMSTAWACESPPCSRHEGLPLT